MLADPTHIASADGKIVRSIEDLSAEDLRHLLDLKLAEPETERIAEAHELRRRLWRCLRSMPKETARELAGQIATVDPGLLLETYQDAFLAAAFGPGPVPTVGAFRRGAAEDIA